MRSMGFKKNEEYIKKNKKIGNKSLNVIQNLNLFFQLLLSHTRARIACTSLKFQRPQLREKCFLD